MSLFSAIIVLVLATLVGLAALWFRSRQKALPPSITVPNPVAHQIITDISNEVGKLENVPSHIETAIGVKLEQLREHV